MEVLLSDRFRKMMSDPDARRQIREAMRHPSRKHIIEFKGKKYIMGSPGIDGFEIEDLKPTEKELELWNSLDSESKFHPLLRNDAGVLCFKGDKITRFVHSSNGVSLDSFRNQEFEIAEIKRYYRNIGSTLAGFCENFGKNKKS